MKKNIKMILVASLLMATLASTGCALNPGIDLIQSDDLKSNSYKQELVITEPKANLTELEKLENSYQTLKLNNAAEMYVYGRKISGPEVGRSPGKAIDGLIQLSSYTKLENDCGINIDTFLCFHELSGDFVKSNNLVPLGRQIISAFFVEEDVMIDGKKVTIFYNTLNLNSNADPFTPILAFPNQQLVDEYHVNNDDIGFKTLFLVVDIATGEISKEDYFHAQQKIESGTALFGGLDSRENAIREVSEYIAKEKENSEQQKMQTC